MSNEPHCPYCGTVAELVTGGVVYPNRPDLAAIYIWRCVPCDARVGCHGRGTRPKGRLANAALREAKMRAHASFDQVWKGGGMRRDDAYDWLACQLGLTRGECHIGMFDEAACERVVEVSEAWLRSRGDGQAVAERIVAYAP